MVFGMVRGILRRNRFRSVFCRDVRKIMVFGMIREILRRSRSIVRLTARLDFIMDDVFRSPDFRPFANPDIHNRNQSPLGPSK